MEQAERQAVAAFADRLAAALAGLAHDLRAVPAAATEPRPQPARPTGPGRKGQAAAAPEAGPGDSPRAPRGSRQQQLLSLPGLDAAHGMTAREIARSLDWPSTHPHRVAEQLIRQGVIEVVPDATPRAWRRRPH